MEITRYKVGEKVRIKSIDWYEQNKEQDGNFSVSSCYPFFKEMSKYCGQEYTIQSIKGPGKYILNIDEGNKYFFTEKMFEEKEELKEKKNYKPLDGDICFLKSKEWYGIDSVLVYKENTRSIYIQSYIHVTVCSILDCKIGEGSVFTEDCVDFIRPATKEEVMFLYEQLRDQRGEVWNEELKKREKISPMVLESFTINWEQRRYEIAKEAMNAILSNQKWANEYNKGYYKKDVVGNALSYADELIEQLKRT